MAFSVSLESQAWIALPNASTIKRLIDRIIDIPNIDRQASVQLVSVQSPYAKAVNEARHMLWCLGRTEAWASLVTNTEFLLTGNAGVPVEYCGVLALAAFDNSPTFLGMTGNQLRIWARLTDDPAAILLEPVVMILEKYSHLPNNSC